MKKILAIAASLMLALTTFAQDGQSIYKKYSENTNVSAVYISPAMFKLMGSIPEVELGDDDLDITPAIQSLKGMYILDSENRSINNELKEDIQKLVKRGKYELLMEAKDGDELTRIYGIPKGKDYSSLIIFTYEPDECDFICIEGVLSQETLAALISSGM